MFIPFFGTALGAACVFFLKKDLSPRVQKGFRGGAAGVMVEASFFSLLLPCIEQSEGMGKLKFIPAAIGLWAGFLLMMLLDVVIPALHAHSKNAAMLFLAVTLHNVPEGMAVGAVLAGLADGDAGITSAAAVTLSVGIAFQNFPEGAIISLPLKAKGMGKGKSFLWGALSGAAEPLAAVATFLLAGVLTPMIPYFLSFAAGAMIFVVLEELMTDNSRTGNIFFAIGFTLMLITDCVL